MAVSACLTSASLRDQPIEGVSFNTRSRVQAYVQHPPKTSETANKKSNNLGASVAGIFIFHGAQRCCVLVSFTADAMFVVLVFDAADPKGLSPRFRIRTRDVR
ncbi:hypothetical protein AG1IA_01688 [Rhizoctonia solani AG-1 IA]|uniref:Uncharacterized protein n=1 Tax=Thanatephorus cucumeris (strain AG1-IA) TaxID=983506 RepID=L8X1X2_THACA|nr:hypothetical protein AG1IA_01688 [Rhizoctonia solani AG-1 IA]